MRYIFAIFLVFLLEASAAAHLATCEKMQIKEIVLKIKEAEANADGSAGLNCLNNLGEDRNRLSQLSEEEILNVASLLNEKNPSIQIAAAGFLAGVGGRAKVALPILQEALENWKKSIKGAIGPSMDSGYVMEWAISMIKGAN